MSIIELQSEGTFMIKTNQNKIIVGTNNGMLVSIDTTTPHMQSNTQLMFSNVKLNCACVFRL